MAFEAGSGGASPTPAGAGAAGIAAQRYAYIRLNQAVQAGLLPASVLQNAHPAQYAALWRMVSQHVTQPANAAGYADPGYWLRQGGGQRPAPVRPPGPGEAGAGPGDYPDVPQNPGPSHAPQFLGPPIQQNPNPHYLGPPIIQNPNVSPNQVVAGGGVMRQPPQPFHITQLIGAGMAGYGPAPGRQIYNPGSR